MPAHSIVHYLTKKGKLISDDITECHILKTLLLSGNPNTQKGNVTVKKLLQRLNTLKHVHMHSVLKLSLRSREPYVSAGHCPELTVPWRPSTRRRFRSGAGDEPSLSHVPNSLTSTSMTEVTTARCTSLLPSSRTCQWHFSESLTELHTVTFSTTEFLELRPRNG